MANDFYFNPIERVAGIADSCGMQIMSSTRRPYATAGRPTCSRQEQTCVRFRYCSATWISRPLPGISIYRSDTCRPCRTRWSIYNYRALARYPASITGKKINDPASRGGGRRLFVHVANLLLSVSDLAICTKPASRVAGGVVRFGRTIAKVHFTATAVRTLSNESVSKLSP